MDKKVTFSRNLNAWYARNARDLPWRGTSDPYKIWVSEVMLQQTTVNAVIPYYDRWMNMFPTVASVTHARPEKILKMWQGLGYYQRAKNLHKAAKIICEKYNGKIPADAGQLKKMPGFGPYTTGAVLSIAFNIRHPIVDANVRRVIMRFLAVSGYADAAKDSKALRFLEKAMPQRNVGTFNQALMELGALVCRNREPLCLQCPVKAGCQAYEKSIQDIIPQPKKRIIKDVDVSVGILKRNGRYFIQKRPSKGLLADLWEFPGGKIEQGETPQGALKRELKEELGIEMDSAKHLMNTKHFYTQFRVNLHVFSCAVKSYPSAHKMRKWISLKDLSKYPMPSGSAKIVEKISSLS